MEMPMTEKQARLHNAMRAKGSDEYEAGLLVQLITIAHELAEEDDQGEEA